MLHPDLRRHLSWPLLVQITDPHRKFQRKRLHKSPETVSSRWVTLATWPPVHHPLSRAQRILFIGRLVFRRTNRCFIIIKSLETRSNLKLMQDIIEHQVWSDFQTKVLAHVPLQPLHQRRHCQNWLNHSPRLRTFRNSRIPSTTTFLWTISTLLFLRTLLQAGHNSTIQINRCFVVTHLQGVCSIFFACREARPPFLHLQPNRELSAVQPQGKRPLVNVQHTTLSISWRIAYAITRRTVHSNASRHILWTNKIHIKTCGDVLLRGRQVNCAGNAILDVKLLDLVRFEHHATNFLRRKVELQLVSIHHVEQSRVIVLVHGLFFGATKPPRPVPVSRKCTQSLQQVRNKRPTHLQAF